MDQEPDHHQVMEMLNATLREMKGELGEVDSLSLKGSKKQLAKHMHKIYDSISTLIDKYEHSHEHEDLNYVFKQIEILKPAFVLNYNEILR